MCFDSDKSTCILPYEVIHFIICHNINHLPSDRECIHLIPLHLGQISAPLPFLVLQEHQPCVAPVTCFVLSFPMLMWPLVYDALPNQIPPVPQSLVQDSPPPTLHPGFLANLIAHFGYVLLYHSHPFMNLSSVKAEKAKTMAFPVKSLIW